MPQICYSASESFIFQPLDLTLLPDLCTTGKSSGRSNMHVRLDFVMVFESGNLCRRAHSTTSRLLLGYLFSHTLILLGYATISQLSSPELWGSLVCVYPSWRASLWNSMMIGVSGHLQRRLLNHLQLSRPCSSDMLCHRM